MMNEIFNNEEKFQKRETSKSTQSEPNHKTRSQLSSFIWQIHVFFEKKKKENV